jgi:hypothetical protein
VGLFNYLLYDGMAGLPWGAQPYARSRWAHLIANPRSHPTLYILDSPELSLPYVRTRKVEDANTDVSLEMLKFRPYDSSAGSSPDASTKPLYIPTEPYANVVILILCRFSFEEMI